MNPSTYFFLLYIVVCLSIGLLFYYLFKRSEVRPTMSTAKKMSTPFEFLRKKMNKDIPGIGKIEVGKPLSMPNDPLRRKMNKGEVEKPASTPYDFLRKKMNKSISENKSERGKPLPPPKMPVAPVPLIVRT